METVRRVFEEELVAKLHEIGMDSEPVSVTKNGVVCTGIRVMDPESPQISPVVYYSQNENVDEIIERIENAVRTVPAQICVDQLTDPDYLIDHIYMTIQRCGKDPDDVLKKSCLNLELVLRVALKLGEGTGSVKISRTMLKLADVSEDVAWMMAKQNMLKRLHICGIAEALGFPSELMEDFPMAVCTTGEKTDGAVALAIPEIFAEYCSSSGFSGLYLIPSSTEELLCVPDDYGLDPMEVTFMIQDINQSMVDSMIQLDPVLYHYDSIQNTIAVVASFNQKGGVQ